MSVALRKPPRQLALALPHEESLSRENFLEGPCNANALALVESWPDWPNRIMLLAGPEGGGKSHLAAIWADIAGARTISAHSLTTENVPVSLATCALVIDDLDHRPSTCTRCFIFSIWRARRRLRADDVPPSANAVRY